MSKIIKTLWLNNKFSELFLTYSPNFVTSMFDESTKDRASVSIVVSSLPLSIDFPELDTPSSGLIILFTMKVFSWSHFWEIIFQSSINSLGNGFKYLQQMMKKSIIDYQY